MPAPFHTAAGLIQQQHAWFLYALRRLVDIRPATLLDGQLHENAYYEGGTHVALSDTDRNTKTDKLGKRRSYGTISIELIATEQAYRGQGAASHQLKALGKLADKWNITLRVLPAAQPGSPLTDADLLAWYQRHGFTDLDGLYLKRLPAEQKKKGGRVLEEAVVA